MKVILLNRLEQLIQELCPEGVEYVKLNTIAKRNSGTNITASQMKSLHKDGAPVRVFAAGNTIADVDYDAVPAKNVITTPSIITKSRGYIGFEYYFKPFTHKSEMWSYTVINEFTDTKFIYYYLLTKVNALQKKARSDSVKLPQLSIKDTDNIQIPLPPVSVQCEIVRILDNFTELTAELTRELTAELKARKKQYEYYRDNLLDFGDKSQMMPLGDILKIKNGKDYKAFNAGDIPVYGTGGIMTYIDTFAYDKPSVLIPRKGSLDKLYYVDKPFWTVDTIFYSEININKAIPKYVFYCLQKERLNKYNTAGGVPSLTQTLLNKVEISVPSLPEQERIVKILDRFVKLCNDISEGLAAEIEARKQQYEYYRNKLLTFKEVSHEKL